MTTFEEIKKANETIQTLSISRKDKNGNEIGKEYAEVNQRIKAFRMVYPMGSITTEIVSLANGVVTMKATASTDDGYVLGTGYAQEKEGSTFINKTSFIENCETSAVGRALGMCGFGIDTSVASAEEVQNAMANQEQKADRKITDEQFDFIADNCSDEQINWCLNKLKKGSVNELTFKEASWFIKKFNEKKEVKENA